MAVAHVHARILCAEPHLFACSQMFFVTGILDNTYWLRRMENVRTNTLSSRRSHATSTRDLSVDLWAAAAAAAVPVQYSCAGAVAGGYGGGGGPGDQGVMAWAIYFAVVWSVSHIYCCELARNRHHLEVKWPRVVGNLNEPWGARFMAVLLSAKFTCVCVCV